MKALQKTTAAFGLEWRDVPEPGQPGAHDVIVEVTAAGICGSDVHIYDWSGGYDFLRAAFPVTLGHEFAGRVATLGAEVSTLQRGDAVVVIPSVECGVCEYCVSGRVDECRERRGIGMMRDGAFASRVRVPARNCLTLPPGMDAGVASLAEPLSIGMSAVKTAEVHAGDRVLVMGPGTIGQAIAVLAKARGARVALVGHDDAERLATARALGIEATLDLDGAPEGAMRTLLGENEYDIVIEATGVGAAVQAGLDVLRPSGVFVVCGIHGKPISFDGAKLVRLRHQIRGTYRATRATWQEVRDFLVENHAALGPMVTHRLPLAQAIEGFEMARNKIGSKIVLVP
ncbi:MULTISPECIES: NAD(P)-dependent sugar dehydrogenase [Pandoraea]|uniref:L-threonine 3-dehydrogenase n=1 Tax=Pandoraea communis TaxID=2508297 RepID=A0A5E4YSV0_9BURK|nr:MULTISPECIES: NAD(P)-dependent sugar dehydrogenase [Pandoraea]EON14066.1 molecular chaperone GroES [Pandoraea sp. SD6-2]VVE51572.1 L-threonine 3-dehydrogenase [Pandoraea communis]